MTTSSTYRRVWLLIGLAFALVLSTGTVAADANKKRCEGTKKQRKQKMEKRDISDAQLEEMIEQYRKTNRADRAEMSETVLRRFLREYEEHQATGAPFVYDILIVSGGGAKGAFGAGFFEGWATVTSGANARPEFDMVTGVSTGALVAPFAYIGTDKAYASVIEFYANPEPNWVKKRGWIKFLPSHVSLYNNCHLQDTIREAIDPSVVERMAEAAGEDRLVLIGATNLDVGAGRVFDLGREAQKAVQGGTPDRIHSILLASSAIPGAFPPIEIDEMLYADGGATSNLFITTFPGPDGPFPRFRAQHPQAPLPKVRVWILVNQQLKPQHAVTQPRWLSVSGRALSTLASTSQLFALSLMKEMALEARVERGVDVELRFVSIPADAPKPATEKMFDKEYMLALEDLGRRMGADPSSWRTEVPSAFRVEGGWPDSD